MPTRLHQFESLCLSHCLIGLSGLEILCKGLYGETSLRYLDLSWNNIPLEGMSHIVTMLQENKTLEKLYIQHNNLGP